MTLISRLRARRPSRGQSLVEFALVLPVMLGLLAGALDLGRVFYANITIANAAREGAFQAARTPQSYQAGAPCDLATNQVVCAVQLESKDSMVTVAPGDITMTCGTAGCPAQANSSVTVNVRGQFRLLTPILSSVFGGQTLGLNSSATAQINYIPDPAAPLPSVIPNVVADFDVDDSTPAVGQTVQFTDTSTGSPTSWHWDFGDGTISNAQNPTHVFTSASTFNVVLTVSNVSDADFTQRSIVVSGSAPPPSPSPSPGASPSPSPSPACSIVPNVVGERWQDAAILIGAAGLVPEGYGDLTTGPKGKVQTQNIDAGECEDAGTAIVFHYRPN